MKTSFSDSEFPLRFVSKRSSSTIKTGFQRFQRPVYDYPSKYSPCRAACPAAHDIALALFLASKGRFDLARELFLEESPFPGITGRVCYHPCETACNRAGYDEAIAINALERAIDAYGTEPFEAPKTAYPESVGIVGAGPAGMTCAYHLRLLGYAVTVYDANPTPGGMLSHGIPAYRLPPEVTQKATAELQALGVEFICGVCVGRDISFEELRRRHTALFLAPGLSKSRKIAGLPETPRAVSGLDFLRAVRANGKMPLSGRVLVLGGGDVAVDAARSALRCGAASVTICCPEPAGEMPAHPQEVSSALAEGILVADRILPEAVQQCEDGITVRFRKVEAVERKGSGYSFRTGAETAVHGPADYLIYAIGQEAELSFLPEGLCENGRIACGPFGETAEPGVFAGGDAVGTYNVVNAIASAKRAAVGIDCYLRGWSTDGLEQRISVGLGGPISMRAYRDIRRGLCVTPAVEKVPLELINLYYFPKAPRVALPKAGSTTDFSEVNLTLDRTAAEAEARRCFNCGLCNMCGNCFQFCPDSAVLRRKGWGFEIDLDHCKGCAVCVEECPRGAMSMVPEPNTEAE